AAVPHPDSLQMLHATATLLLCHAALRGASFPTAIAAMGLSGLGVLTKQTAMFTVVGAGIALILGGRWGWRRSLVLAGTGIGTAACVLVPMLLARNARFFLVTLPLSEKIVWSKIPVFFDDFFRGHRLVLSVLAPACAAALVRHDARLR